MGRAKMDENDWMKWNSTSVLSLLTGAIVAAGVGAARADELHKCVEPVIETKPSVLRQWPDLAAEIRAAFETRGDVDTCARITVVVEESGIALKVVLPDGRTATRSVSRRDDVVPALEALLVLPDPGPDAESSPSTPAATVAVQTEAESDSALGPVLREHVSTVTAASPFRIEIAVDADARTGDGVFGAGGGVASFLDIAHWLVGFQGRIDRYQPIAGGIRTMALELTALGGHRFGLGASTLDVVAGPALALRGTATVVTQTMVATAGPMTQTTTNQSLPRLILSTRLNFGTRSLLRTFVEMDLDLDAKIDSSSSSAGSASNSPPSVIEPPPGLPAWTVGVAFGAALGTR